MLPSLFQSGIHTCSSCQNIWHFHLQILLYSFVYNQIKIEQNNMRKTIALAILGLIHFARSDIMPHNQLTEQDGGWKNLQYPEFWESYDWRGPQSIFCRNKCSTGEICVVPEGQGNRKAICYPICGDGQLFGIQKINGNCDDGNKISGDGCSKCKVDPTYSCTGQPSICYKCGNGIRQPNQECDNGLSLVEDGCSNSCTVSPGWACTQSTQHETLCTLLPICNNNIVESGEQCDNGSYSYEDGCDDTCHVIPGYTCLTYSGSSICDCDVFDDINNVCIRPI